jgi:hypothetical protein
MYTWSLIVCWRFVLSQISKIVFERSWWTTRFCYFRNKLHPKTTVVQGIMAYEAADLMKFFAEKKVEWKMFSSPDSSENHLCANPETSGRHIRL